MKYTRFSDIPQFTRNGNWESNFDLVNLIKYIDEEIENFGLNLEPDFQRNHVWTTEQQIAYLEYILRGGKSGKVIYLNNPSWNYSVKPDAYNEYVCVDGLQRLTAIRKFVNDEIKVFESYYSEFEDSIRLSQTLRVNVNDLQTKKEVLQWYLDMNTGGTPHTNNEINKVRKMLDEENFNHFNNTEEDQVR